MCVVLPAKQWISRLIIFRAAWLGLKENEAAAREAFMVRVKANGEAAAAKPL